jgi:hypothetical protein
VVLRPGATQVHVLCAADVTVSLCFTLVWRAVVALRLQPCHDDEFWVFLGLSALPASANSYIFYSF